MKTRPALEPPELFRQKIVNRQQYLDQAREAWQDMPYLWENLDL